MVAAVALAIWGCNGAPEPKTNKKSARDAGPVDTDAIAVGVDADQPTVDMLDETLDEESDAGDGTD